ncbi:MAG: cysteine desulfurase family protein [Pirellulales bacterium]
MRKINLDQNATTPLDPRVREAIDDAWRAEYANAASQHALGRRARSALEDARERISAVLGARRPGTRLVMTSGGTEANNLALFGLAGESPGRVVVSAIEHASVLASAARLERRGWEVVRIGATGDGVIDLDQLLAAISKPTRLVSLMWGNNDTGVLQPIAEVAEICRAAGVPLHTDAVQAVGKLAVDFDRLGATALSLAAHKFHGPRGIGALVVDGDAPLESVLCGGFHQQGLRPGTESVELAIGLCRALELWASEADERYQRMARLRDRFEGLLRAGRAGLVVNGANAARLPHTSNVSFVGLDRQELFVALDLAGVHCSPGSACASGSSEPSAVLQAMGLPDTLLNSALRFSLGATTTEVEVDDAAARILQVCNDLEGSKLGRKIAATSPAGTSNSL